MMQPFADQHQEDTTPEASANPGYAWGQLAAALRTSQTHPDPATRTRATQKAQDWLQVLQGMLSDTLQVGSRTPVKDTPAWATLAVVKGGFATGNLLAEGELQPHEKERLVRLPTETSAPPRAILNGYYLSDAGIAELQEQLQSGCYRVNVPEEGTLLVVAWLLAQQQAEKAWEILDAIGPYLDRLRFYPVPASRPLSDASAVSMETVGQTIEYLQALEVPRQIVAQREAILVWIPLYDRLLSLFLETVEGPAPSLQTGPDGKPIRNENGQFTLEGGWPCQHYPEDWQARAKAWLEEYQQRREEHRLCGKPERKGENFSLLRQYLALCVQAPQDLTGRAVGWIRMILAHSVTRRGLPTEERCQNLRRFQHTQISRPTKVDLSQVVLERLRSLPSEEGLDDLETALAPITAEEALKYRLPVGHSLQEPFRGTLRRCLAAPVEVLVAQGIIASGEVLARVIPQMTAQIAAASVTDKDLRRLYGAVYQAFRRRRSLLLLNLESQVKFTELPWVQAVEAQREQSLSTQDLARQTLEQVALLAITAFPQQILPNKLLQELRALAESAGLTLPWVEEMAADIFMGAFVEKYLRAAQRAGQLLEGTLYERYYGLSYARVQEMPLQPKKEQPSSPRHPRPATSSEFFQLCQELAKPAEEGSWVARNGSILEQEQILTTHNLAPLFLTFGWQKTLQPRLVELAQKGFVWIGQQHLQTPPHWQTRLRRLKNTAYAWRQMVFFLSLVPVEEAETFLLWAYDHLNQQPLPFRTRFWPALDGLARALQGQSPEIPNREGHPNPPRRLLGWTTGSHWLLDS